MWKFSALTCRGAQRVQWACLMAVCIAVTESVMGYRLVWHSRPPDRRIASLGPSHPKPKAQQHRQRSGEVIGVRE